MIKSKFKILTLIIRCFLLAVGIGALIMSILFLNIIVNEFSMVGLFGTLVFSMLALLFLYISVDAVRTVSIDFKNSVIKMNYLGIYSRVIDKNELSGFALKPFSNRLGTFKGILLQTSNKEQFQFSAFDYSNYSDLESIIKKFAPLDNSIKLNFLPPFAKVFYAYAGIVIVSMILFKAIAD